MFLSLAMLNILCTALLPKFYPVKLLHSSCKNVFTIRETNSADPDQLASSEASLSGYTLSSKKDKSRFSRTRVNANVVKLSCFIAIFLTLCILMNSSIRFDTTKLGWFIVHIKGSQLKLSK